MPLLLHSLTFLLPPSRIFYYHVLSFSFLFLFPHILSSILSPSPYWPSRTSKFNRMWYSQLNSSFRVYFYDFAIFACPPTNQMSPTLSSVNQRLLEMSSIPWTTFSLSPFYRCFTCQFVTFISHFLLASVV